MSNRRGFLKLIGLAPIAAPVMAQAESVNHLRGLAWVGGGNLAEPSMGSSSPVWARVGLSKSIWKLLNREREERQNDYSRKIAYRMGAIDLDIHVMRSWSPSFQIHQQQRRDIAHHEFLTGMNSRLWPGDDE